MIDDLMEHVSLLTDITDELEIDEEDMVSVEIESKVDSIIMHLRSKI